MDVRGNQLCVLLLGALLVATPRAVQGEFILTVNLVNYTNPTGLCAECGVSLSDAGSADNLVPVCCDDQPLRNTNCNNTGEERCDTRFRWTIRPFGASLETRPATMQNANNPPYFFTDCPMSPSTCPFSETSTTFGQGLTALLGVTGNPLLVSKPDFTMWMGRIQFFIEAVDSMLPNIIDSLLIDLDNLQLGADFTEEMTFTGFHNISHMTMSFRVECSPGFCGPDCSTTPQNNPRVATCRADGSLTCSDNRFDPSPFVACKDCLYNLDITTGCSICVHASYDPTTNCKSCLGTNFNPSNGCTSCLLEVYNLQTNCTQCLPNRDLSTNCTRCLPGWDITSDCTSCLPNRDPVTNCSLCLQPDRFTHTDCSVCALPGGDPATLCQTCLATNFDSNTNCSECVGNYDLGSSCSTCLPGYDSSRGCAVCLFGRNISTRCTTCLSGFTGSNCEPAPSVEFDLVAGIAGGVSGALFLVIIPLVIVVCVLVCQFRRRCHVKFVSDEGVARTAYNNTGTGTGTGSSAEHKFQNPIYGPGLEMNSKTGTGSSDDRTFTNSLYETSNVHTEDDYSHPSVSPPSHMVKTGTQDLTSTLDGPTYDTASCLDNNLPREGTPVYDTADLTHRPPPTNPLDEDYSKLCQPPVTSVTPQPTSSLADYDTATFIEQPVYDEAFPPPDDSLSKKGARHPSKSAGAYEEIEDEDIRGRDEYDTTYPPPAVIPSVNAYSKLGKHEAELPAYDVANNHNPKQVQPKAPPPNGSLYDTADYPQEQAARPERDYTETSDFLPTLIKEETSQRTYDYADANEFLSASSSVKHSYDYCGILTTWN